MTWNLPAGTSMFLIRFGVMAFGYGIAVLISLPACLAYGHYKQSHDHVWLRYL
jgi:hypothetical protein